MQCVREFLKQRRTSPTSRWAVGNEAGDLDSLACAIAYAYLRSTLSDEVWTPILQTRRRDVALRPENGAALTASGLSTDDIACIDEVEPTNDTVVALVDHNVATRRVPQRVSAIIDHHVDSGAHLDASPRIVKRPEEAGSCASVLTCYFMPQLSGTFPRPLADLLLGAIGVDTIGWDDSAGKAQEPDRVARDFLLPQSSLTPERLAQHIAELMAARDDVSHLPTPEQIRRDYKEFVCPSASDMPWRIGAASVALSLREWVGREKDTFASELEQFTQEHGLDALVSLSGYKDTELRRELLFYAPSTNGADALPAALAEHRGDGVALEKLDVGLNDVRLHAWRQLDARVTRKQFAPALQAVCARCPKTQSQHYGKAQSSGQDYTAPQGQSGP